MPRSEARAEVVIVLEDARDAKIEILSLGITTADHETIFADLADVGDISAAERNLPW